MLLSIYSLLTDPNKMECIAGNERGRESTSAEVVYVLELDEGKLYVGKSKDVESRSETKYESILML